MRVLVWDTDRNHEGVFLYATLGASRRPIGEAGSGHRIELYCGVLPDEPSVADALALLAAYPGLFTTELGHGHTVPYDEPLWTGTDMKHYLVTRPVEPIIEDLALPDDSHVEFLTAIPVYSDEIAFKQKHGVDDLRATWRRLGVPFWDPRRPRPNLTDTADRPIR